MKYVLRGDGTPALLCPDHKVHRNLSKKRKRLPGAGDSKQDEEVQEVEDDGDQDDAEREAVAAAHAGVGGVGEEGAAAASSRAPTANDIAAACHRAVLACKTRESEHRNRIIAALRYMDAHPTAQEKQQQERHAARLLADGARQQELAEKALKVDELAASVALAQCLDAAQREALKAAVAVVPSSRALVLMGGPGSGKVRTCTWTCCVYVVRSCVCSPSFSRRIRMIVDVLRNSFPVCCRTTRANSVLCFEHVHVRVRDTATSHARACTYALTHIYIHVQTKTKTRRGSC